MPSSPPRRLLVTGASGNLGRRTVELLLASGQDQIVAATRSPEKIADLADRGALVVEADFDRPETLDAAFADIDGLLMISASSTGVPDLRQRQHLAAVEAALRAGVRHIVYTSMASPEPGSPIPFAPDHHITEQAIERSGLPFTILRVGWYAEAIHLYVPRALKSGNWLSSAGDGRVSYVARNDVARAAAAALSSGVAEGRLNVTGPEALSVQDIVATVNAALGQDIDLVRLDDGGLKDALADAGVPAGLGALLVAIDANSRAGRSDVVSDTIERLTGTAPRSLADYLAEHRQAFLQPA